MASATRALTRVRKASPMSRFLPETRNGIVTSNGPEGSHPAIICYQHMSYGRVPTLSTRPRGVPGEASTHGRGRLLASALDRGRDLHRFTVFRHGAARDVDAGGAQL